MMSTPMNRFRSSSRELTKIPPLSKEDTDRGNHYGVSISIFFSFIRSKKRDPTAAYSTSETTKIG